jgi:hypothetical protein
MVNGKVISWASSYGVLRHAQSILIGSCTDIYCPDGGGGLHIFMARYMRHEVMKYAWILH